jgi:dTDP-4-dehydrorhamnose reductase
MAIRMLVTGVEGQLARSLAERAVARDDITVVCVGRPELDLENPEAIERAVRERSPDIVVGAAAYTAVNRAEDEFQTAMRINAEAASVLARAACDSGARLMHISTDFVYDGRRARPTSRSTLLLP